MRKALLFAAVSVFCLLQTVPHDSAGEDGVLIDEVVLASGCSDQTTDPTVATSMRVVGLHLGGESMDQMELTVEVANEGGSPMVFCRQGEPPAGDLEQVEGSAKARKIEVTILDDGQSQSIALMPGGALPAVGPNHSAKTTHRDPFVLRFVPLTSDGEDVTVIVKRTYKGKDGTVYGPGTYSWQKGRLVPTEKP